MPAVYCADGTRPDNRATFGDRCQPGRIMLLWEKFRTETLGPVAQLGARFHGMEEVGGSNPPRSTIYFNELARVSPYGVPSRGFVSTISRGRFRPNMVANALRSGLPTV